MSAPGIVNFSAAAKNVQQEAKQLQADQKLVSDAKGSPDAAAKLAAAAPQIQKDWEKFTADAAGLQQSSDYTDRVAVGDAYRDANTAYQQTQGDLKEVLGANGNDPNFGALQSATQSIIDQGNAMVSHIAEFRASDGGPERDAPLNGAPLNINDGGTQDVNTTLSGAQQYFADAGLAVTG